MSKFIGLAAFLILGGSSQQIHVTFSPYETHIQVDESTLQQHANSPLTEHQWLMRQALGSVPVFESGAARERVIDALIDQNLFVLMESPDYLVVREGVPLIDMTGPKREKYVYGFDNDRLVLGPLSYSQAQMSFVAKGLTGEHIAILKMIADSEPLDSVVLNEFAWLRATHPDAHLRDPQLAIDYARRAIELDTMTEWMHVDTLAAAYAAAGDFENAVLEQRRAIRLNYLVDDGSSKRLEMYSNRQAYVAPLSDWHEAAGDKELPMPRPELLAAASSGSPEDQWRLAAFYIENDINEGQGMMNPGFFWLEQAALNEHPLAVNEVGFCYYMALCGVDMDYAAAAKWFGRAAESGDTTGAFNFARVLANGHGIERDDRKATQWFERAADGGIAAGAFMAAMRHREGVGAPANPIAQHKFMKIASDKGYGPADFLLDDQFFQRFFGGEAIAAVLDRDGVLPHETADALMSLIARFERASETKDGTLIVDFGDGQVFEYDDSYTSELTLNLTRIAASLGSAEAQNRYADYFAKGRIVSRSLTEANYWRQRAAH